MLTQHRIPLVGGAHDETANFSQITSGEDCGLICEFRGKTIKTIACDFFEALCEVRKELERDGLTPFCYGASLNVYPSGMGRQMGEGLRAYRLTMGKLSSEQQLVGIFEQGRDIIPASVEQQERFYHDWCNKQKDGAMSDGDAGTNNGDYPNYLMEFGDIGEFELSVSFREPWDIAKRKSSLTHFLAVMKDVACGYSNRMMFDSGLYEIETFQVDLVSHKIKMKARGV